MENSTTALDLKQIAVCAGSGQEEDKLCFPDLVYQKPVRCYVTFAEADVDIGRSTMLSICFNLFWKSRKGAVPLVCCLVLCHFFGFPHGSYGFGVWYVPVAAEWNAVFTDGLPQEHIDCSGQVKAKISKQFLRLSLGLGINGNAGRNFRHDGSPLSLLLYDQHVGKSI